MHASRYTALRSGALGQGGPPRDRTGPVVTAAEMQADGQTVVVTFGEAATGTVGLRLTGNKDGATRALAYVSGSPGLAFTLQQADRLYFTGEVLLLSLVGQAITDAAGNPVLPFTGFPITNLSEQADADGPQVTTVSTDETGEVLTIAFNEDYTGTGTGFAVVYDGVALVLANPTHPLPTQLHFDILNYTVITSEFGTYTYTDGDVEDVFGNAMANTSGTAASGSTVGGGNLDDVSTPGTDTYTPVVTRNHSVKVWGGGGTGDRSGGGGGGYAFGSVYLVRGVAYDRVVGGPGQASSLDAAGPGAVIGGAGLGPADPGTGGVAGTGSGAGASETRTGGTGSSSGVDLGGGGGGGAGEGLNGQNASFQNGGLGLGAGGGDGGLGGGTAGIGGISATEDGANGNLAAGGGGGRSSAGATDGLGGNGRIKIGWGSNQPPVAPP